MIFLTGSTGFLGHELLGRLLVRQATEKICVLVRPGATQTAESRIRKSLQAVFEGHSAAALSAQLEVIAGDVTHENFGLGTSEFDALASRVDTVIHCAADTTLVQPLEHSRATNVGGTRNVLKFAHRARALRGERVRFFQVSTAYVAGDTERTVQPGEIGSSFKNSYEQSKAEAERDVWASAENLDVCFFRPSVVVGDSVTGQTRTFNVIYVPARLLMSGLFKALPAFPNVPFDVVPVDYVADAMEILTRRQPRKYNCYHLTVGVGRESTPLEILEEIVQTYNKCRKKGWKRLLMPPLVSPEKIAHAVMTSPLMNSPLGRAGFKTLERLAHKNIHLVQHAAPFVPYMMRNPRFDTTATLDELNNALALPPLFTTYAERVFKYCLDTNWGRRQWSNPSNYTPWFQRPEFVLK